jgi:predicted alpha-1,6-mannanase (GH76 family)
VNAPGGFLNKYYDDEGWWALAWIDAYDWTHNPDYLNMASSIFDDMTGGWDDHCGGGIWWSRDRTYKNAIANELFLSVASHLANRVTDPDEKAQLLAWADSEWQWFSQSGLINQDNLINDGLNSNCQNNGQTTWTYNQGVILGGLVELYQQDQDPSLLETAQTIALAPGCAVCQLHRCQWAEHLGQRSRIRLSVWAGVVWSLRCSKCRDADLGIGCPNRGGGNHSTRVRE